MSDDCCEVTVVVSDDVVVVEDVVTDLVQVVEQGEVVAVIDTEIDVVVVDRSDVVVVDDSVGPQGPPGPPGPAGAATQEVFVQNATPIVPVGQPYAWFQTGLGSGADFTLWFGLGPAV